LLAQKPIPQESGTGRPSGRPEGEGMDGLSQIFRKEKSDCRQASQRESYLDVPNQNSAEQPNLTDFSQPVG